MQLSRTKDLPLLIRRWEQYFRAYKECRILLLSQELQLNYSRIQEPSKYLQDQSTRQ